jgi:hypothetical protein
VTVTGAPTEIFARDLGRFVTNSNLVKCAIAGCDPNVGRIVGAIGSFLGNYVENGAQYTAGLSVTLGGIDIFSDGCFQLNPEKVGTVGSYPRLASCAGCGSKERESAFPPHVSVGSLRAGEAVVRLLVQLPALPRRHARARPQLPPAQVCILCVCVLSGPVRSGPVRGLKAGASHTLPSFRRQPERGDHHRDEGTVHCAYAVVCMLLYRRSRQSPPHHLPCAIPRRVGRRARSSSGAT